MTNARFQIDFLRDAKRRRRGSAITAIDDCDRSQREMSSKCESDVGRLARLTRLARCATEKSLETATTQAPHCSA